MYFNPNSDSEPAQSRRTAPELTLTWSRLAKILLARHWLVWGACLLLGGGAVVLSKLVLPTLYTASADVLLDIRESDPVQGQTQTPSLISAGYVATQADIITSDRVARKVVRTLGLDSNPAAVQQWHDAGEGGTIEQYYMDALRKALEVRPSRMSNVLSVKFSSPSPSYAATVANAFAKAYVETNVELRADPARDFKTWFDVRTAQARTNLEQAQARLSQFERDKGIVIPSDEHIDVEIARLNELNSQLTTVQGQHAESASRRSQAEDKMGSSPDVLQNPLIQTLRGEVARAEAKQDQVAKEYGLNHPSYKSSAAELASLKEKLETEIQRVATSVGGSNSVNEQKERQIHLALEEQKRRVLQLRAQHDAASVLRNDVESAQKAYDLILQHLSATNLESQVQQTNVVVLSEALPPSKKSSPHTLLNVALGSFLGLLFGAALAVALEMRRPRLRIAGDVVSLLQIPVLASMPRVASRARRRPVTPRALPQGAAA
jgi:chain length determinant protein EpsF